MVNSAGSGRTGTFIALHSIMMQWRQHEEKRKSTSRGIDGMPFPFNVFEFVRFLRQARIGMVESAEQYEFIYACLVQDLDRNPDGGWADE
jgi:protein tyrosine phosphatase